MARHEATCVDWVREPNSDLDDAILEALKERIERAKRLRIKNTSQGKELVQTKAQHAEEVTKLKEENEVLLAKIAEMQPDYEKVVASRREQNACLELQVKIDESNAKTRQL